MRGAEGKGWESIPLMWRRERKEGRRDRKGGKKEGQNKFFISFLSPLKTENDILMILVSNSKEPQIVSVFWSRYDFLVFQ